uniref:SET domain-containing protein n=1 Tax=Ditylenchus dipsaci TaxID=166011 RepID=A0A915CL16_9BILA
MKPAEATQQLDIQLRNAEDAFKRNQCPPTARPRRDRQQSIAEDCQFQDECSHRSNSQFNDTLKELQPITLRDMKAPMVHTGKYLACRIITEAYVSVATAFLIEDLNGALLETWLGWQKRVHSSGLPSDVVFVDESDQQKLQWANALQWYKPQKLSVDQLRDRGNQYYGKKDYEWALKYYKKALLIKPDLGVLHLNMAAAFLALDNYHAAFEAAKLALEKGADKEKALMRLGRATYGMRNWKLACHYFKQLSQQYPSNKEAQSELKKTLARFHESEIGQYDLVQLYTLSAKQKVRRLDVADYTGPVCIIDVQGKGKGLVASRDLPKGTLLLVSKAFSIAYKDELPNTAFFGLNLLTRQVDSASQALNVIRTIQTLKCNPEMAGDLYALFAGNLPRDQKIPADKVIDAARIENICTFNSFSNQNEYDSASGSEEIEGHSTPNGLWILPSFINHSCIGNASRTFYGDIMTVYAIKDLKKDEEITFPCVSPLKPYQERLKHFQHYKFICSCRLCQLDSSDPFYEQREKLSERCYALAQLSFADPYQYLHQLEPLVKEMRRSYGNSSELKTQLVCPLLQLSMVYRETQQVRKALEALREAREAMGQILEIESGVDFLLREADCYADLQQWPEAARTLQQAITNYSIRSGANKQLFYLIFPDALRLQQ